MSIEIEEISEVTKGERDEWTKDEWRGKKGQTGERPVEVHK